MRYKLFFYISGPAAELISKRPMSSLVSMKNIIPLLLQIASFALIQIASLYYLFNQNWYVPLPNTTTEPVISCWENTVLFTVSCYQYVILAAVYSKGKPYRQRLIKNYWFLLSAISLTIFVTWLMIYPCKVMAEFMELMFVQPDDQEKFLFKLILTSFPAVHFLLAIFIEVSFFLNSIIYVSKRCHSPYIPNLTPNNFF